MTSDLIPLSEAVLPLSPLAGINRGSLLVAETLDFFLEHVKNALTKNEKTGIESMTSTV